MISEKTRVDLGHVQRTLLLPLWGRAVETQKKKPLLWIERPLKSSIRSITTFPPSRGTSVKSAGLDGSGAAAVSIHAPG